MQSQPYDHEPEYQRDKSFWGERPSGVISEHLLSLHGKTVLDMGAGDGRNALYLAKNGFHVTAVDIAPTGLSNLLEKAAERGLTDRIVAQTADLRTYKPSEHFDNVITLFTLRFLGHTYLIPTLSKMAEATNPGGVNIIDDFTPNGPFAQSNPDDFVTPELLERFYTGRGWTIESLTVRDVPTKREVSPGIPLMHEAVALVARKPE